MSPEKDDLASKSKTSETNEKNEIINTNNHASLEQKMPPASHEHQYDSSIALNLYSSLETPALASARVAELKDQSYVAQAMIRNRNESTEEKYIASIIAARQIEARKEHELELARAIRRHHENEQYKKQLLAVRERGTMEPAPGPLNLAASAEQAATKRLADALQQKYLEESALLQSSSARGNEADMLLQMPEYSRLLTMPRYESRYLSLPTQSLNMFSSSFSSTNSPFLKNQASITGSPYERGNSQFNPTEFDNKSQEMLNALYSSRSSQDIPTVGNLSNAIVGSSNLANIRATMAMPGVSALPVAHSTASWLHPPTGVNHTNASLMSTKSQQYGKHALERQDDTFVPSKRLKGPEVNTNKSIPEGEQHQKRFNKHQCKQWTMKFHELIAFKEQMGHCNVPHGYKDNLPLAMWVKRQRHQYNLMMEKKTSTLTGERIKLLENIGFVWNCLETAWEQHFRDLRDFVQRTGHCAVPSTYKKNPSLASWVVTQRRQCKLLEDGKQSSMTPKRLEKLKQIGFPIKTKKTGSTKK